MSELLSGGALPIGLLMFVGSLIALTLRRTGHRRAVQEFPSLATELGLRHQAPRHGGAQGVLAGELRGRRVHIDPDDQGRILVRFRGQPAIDLRTYEHSLRAPRGMVTLFFGKRELDRFFRTRFASPEVAGQPSLAPELAARVEPLREGRFARNLQALTITSEGVTASFDFGRPRHLPAQAVRELLPTCLDLADLIEPSGTAAEPLSAPPRIADPEALA